MRNSFLLVVMVMLALMPFAHAKLESLMLPEGMRVNSIYMPTIRESVSWSEAKGYPIAHLISVLQSIQAKVNAEKYVDGKWVTMNKKEFIEMLKNGKIKAQPPVAAGYGTSKMTRKPAASEDMIGNCQSIFNPIRKSAISLRDWKRMNPKDQQTILSHPYTKRYLERCRGA